MTERRRQSTDKQPAMGSKPRRVHAWLAPGQDWIVELGGVEIVVRLVERRGRRARVAVEIPPTGIPATAATKLPKAYGQDGAESTVRHCVDHERRLKYDL